MLPIDNTLDFQHATNPPPAYQQAILLEDTTNSRHNEVLPSYSQVTGSFLQTKDIIKQPSSNNDLNVITSQPNSTNLNNIDNYKT
jgi:aminoglycoside/choline kinase family phosphotransferase